MSDSNKGQVALVTGATRGLGAAIAAALKAQGMTVIGTATTQQGAEKISAAGMVGVVLNVTDGDACLALVDKIVQEHGALHVLVNNAGITRDTLAMRLKDEDWDAVLDTNLKAVFRLARAAIKPMMKQRHGRIINITSIVALGGMAKCVDYAAAKGGMLAATKSLAIELGRYNININCVSPGKVQRNADDIDQAAFAKQFSYVNRIGTQGDIASMALYLALPESDYITGQNFVVDGGRSLGLRGS